MHVNKQPVISDETLKTCYLFASLSPTQLLQIRRGMQHLELAEGAFLFEHGQRAERFYVLVEGHLKLFRLSQEGVEKVIEIIRPGESFAEAIMFMSAQIYPVTAQAVTHSQLWSFENKALMGLLQDSFDTCRRLMCDMSMRLRLWLNEIDNLTLQNATYRLINYLLYQMPDTAKTGCGQVNFQIPKHVIASRLSIKPETLSRILQQLVKDQLITVEGRVIHIHDVDKLRIYGQS